MTPNINAIIFDLGKVIVETDLDKTLSAFKAMQNNSDVETRNFFEYELFHQFELGQLSQNDFFQKVKEKLSLNGEIDIIEKAWNSMILGIPQKNIRLLQNLKKNYPTFALSNTNSSHATILNAQLQEHHQINSIHDLFHKVYFSYELKLGKPDKKIFEYVLADLNLTPEQTLFIDDNKDNIRTSKHMGFQTIHLTQQDKLEDELKQVGILK